MARMNRRNVVGRNALWDSPTVVVLVSIILMILLCGVIVSPPSGIGGDDVPAVVSGSKGELASGRNSVSVSESGSKKKTSRLRSAWERFTRTTSYLPTRLQTLRERKEIIGERLSEVREGIETVEEILHGHAHKGSGSGSLGGSSSSIGNKEDYSDQPPLELDEIVDFLTKWIHQLHEALSFVKKGTYEDIWKAYHDLTVKTLYPWDHDYIQQRMPKRRTGDDTIFLSIATYRDENCFHTLTQAFAMSKNPQNLFVGLVQQNCHQDCKSGILEGGKVNDVPPDDDCYQLFCDSDLGHPHCEAKRIRSIMMDEAESLGPYMARYIASKLWYGEEWYMQTDAHMTFSQDWDYQALQDLKNAPSKKPVLSHYPPSHLATSDERKDKPGSRLCGPVFATSDLEAEIVRLEGSNVYDTVKLSTPRFAPFAAAGFFVAPSSMLQEVPFDPFLPWIFMGEEIIMSSRLWTSGYDIFSPTENVVGHIYVRRHKPKFWESVHRTFTMGVHNPLQMMILDRIKYQLGYPESARDILPVKSLITAVEQYSMGTERPLQRYMEMVGLNVTTKQVRDTGWCEDGQPPPGFEHYAHYYDDHAASSS